MDMEPGMFYRVDGTHWAFNQPVLERQKLDLVPFNLGTYFTVHQFRIGKNVVGYRFSGNKIRNGGVYLTIKNGPGPAVGFHLVCRTADLVVYEYPEAGAMAIIPHLGEKVRSIVMEQ